MGQCDTIITSRDAQVRRGASFREGLPPDPGSFVHNADQITTTDMGLGLQATIERTGISPGTIGRPLPGSIAVDGTTVEDANVDSYIPPLNSLLLKISDPEDLLGGAWLHTYGELQANDGICDYGVETDLGDGKHTLTVGTKCQSMTWTIAQDTVPTQTILEAAQYVTGWQTGTARHPNPATGKFYLQGLPEDWIDRSDGNAGNVHVKIVDVYTSPTGQEIVAFHAITARPGALAGSWDVGAGLKEWTAPDGVGDFVAGDVFYSDDAADLFEIDVVLGDGKFTTVAAHAAGTTGSTLTREYGAEGAVVLETTLVPPGDDTIRNKPIWSRLTNSSGGPMGDIVDGTGINLHLTNTSGIVAGTLVLLGADISVTVGSDLVTGVGTTFLADASLGDFVDTPLTLVDGRRVVEIIDDLQLRVDRVYGTTESPVAMNIRPAPVIALTGTYTTAAAANTIVGVGGNLLTLPEGSLVRTPAGEVRRLLVVTNDDSATVTRDWDGTEVAVALTTDYEFVFVRERADWVKVTHPAGPFTTLETEVNVFILTPGQQEVAVGVTSLTWTFNQPWVPSFVANNPWATGLNLQGNSTGTVEMIAPKDSVVFRQAQSSRKKVRFRVVMSSPETILDTGIPYSKEFFIHMQAGGEKPNVIPGTENLTKLVGTLHDDPDDPDDITESLAVRVISDRAVPSPEV